MAFSTNRKYAVRIIYRDGRTILYGPVGSRAEARQLLERSRGRDVEQARVIRWNSPDPGRGGVLSSRPAPPALPAVVVPTPTIDTVYQYPGDPIQITGTDLDLAEALWLDYNDGGPTLNLYFPATSSYYDLVSPNEIHLDLAGTGTRPFTITHANPTTTANPGNTDPGGWDGSELVEDAPEPVFEVTYDQDQDELTITADLPVFVDYDTEGWLDVDTSSGSTAVGANDKYVDDYTLVWTAPILNRPATVTQITFSRGPDYGSRVTEYIWTGSELVSDPAPPVLSLVHNLATNTLELTSDQPTFATWSSGTDQVSINGTGGAGITGTNSATLIAPDELHIYVGIAHTLPYVDITQVDFEQPSGTDIAVWTGVVALNPEVTSSDSTAPGQFEVVGTNLALVNHLYTNGTLTRSYYDPNGPDAGSNPGTATINSWTDTLIDITDTDMPGETISSVHLWAVGDSPDYGTFPFTPYVVDSAPVSPRVDNAYQDGNGGPLRIEGYGFLDYALDHFGIRINNNISAFYTPEMVFVDNENAYLPFVHIQTYMPGWIGGPGTDARIRPYDNNPVGEWNGTLDLQP